MKTFRKVILPILLSAIWISVSEFVRNEILFKNLWVNHYGSLGLEFPAEPINGAIWGIWSLLFALFIFILSRKYNLMQTTFLAWFAGFVLMWIVAGNLGVLPMNLLKFAIPLGLLETFIAALIIRRLK